MVTLKITKITLSGLTISGVLSIVAVDVCISLVVVGVSLIVVLTRLLVLVATATTGVVVVGLLRSCLDEHMQLINQLSESVECSSLRQLEDVARGHGLLQVSGHILSELAGIAPPHYFAVGVPLVSQHLTHKLHNGPEVALTAYSNLIR